MIAAQRKRRPAAGTAKPADINETQRQAYDRPAGKASSQLGRPYQPFPWFKLHSSDWLASTRGLSLSETGALIVLRAMIHERGEPLPEDYARLARQCGAPSAKAFERIVDALIEAKLLFRVAGGLWCLDIAGQIDHQRGVSEAAKQNRSKVGQKSKQKQGEALTGVRRYKNKNGDRDEEGKPLTGVSPSQSKSSSLSTSSDDSDAHKGASGRDLIEGQSIHLGKLGLCKVIQTGKTRQSGRKIIRVLTGHGDDMVIPLDREGFCVISAGREHEPSDLDFIDWKTEGESDAA